jgi:ribosomal protein S18 acetylase RimI-like enzyme
MKENKSIKIFRASTENDTESARTLFIEYAKSLNFNLCFQDFETELKNLPGDYSPPGGEILLAYCNDKLAGCVALRKFGDKISEMKRMFVRPEFRGKKIGEILALKVIQDAVQSGYEKMRLDTIGTMKEAITLYEKLGFREIPPYRYNPVGDVKYMELDLTSFKES